MREVRVFACVSRLRLRCLVVGLAVGAVGAFSAVADAATPSLPDGLNVAIGAKVFANSGAAPPTTLANINDGDGTTRWCPATIGIHRVTVKLGKVQDITGAGATFTGEEGEDGSFFTVSAGVSRRHMTPLPDQAAGDQNSIVQGPLYLFSGDNPTATVRARYVTLTYEVPREQNICVQEFRVFSTSAVSDPRLELGTQFANASTATTSSGDSISGQADSALNILRDGGANTVRIPLFLDATGCNPDCSQLDRALALASAARQAGESVVLDLELSQSAGSTRVPAAWAGQDLQMLSTTVQRYAQRMLQAFAANGTPVTRVAIGSSLEQGLLAPEGVPRFGSSDRADFSGLTAVLKAAIAGVHSASRADRRLPVELDTSTGADQAATTDFFDQMQRAGVEFDVIGLAYSPWLQGPMDALRANLTATTSNFRRPVVVEGQFPFGDVPEYGIWSESNTYPDTLPGYLLTTAGQASYERDLVSLVASLPHGLGLGVTYDAPDTTGGLGLFSSSGAAQPAVDSFRVGSGAVLYDAASPFVSGAGTELPIGNTPGVQPGTPTLPDLPPGLNVAIGAPVTANSGASSDTVLSNVDDGDGTSRFCPGSLGVHQVTIDLGRVESLSGTGVTFSGETSGDGATYSISTGISHPGETPFANQGAGGQNAITSGADYLFAGANASLGVTIQARYITLTWSVASEANICVQELRAFSPDDPAANALQRGDDLSTLLSDTEPFLLNGTKTPLLNIFSDGGENYIRLRLWVNPDTGNFGTPTALPFCDPSVCPDLTHDLQMAKMAQAVGMKVLLDIHYSDTWADPQHQNVPKEFLDETLPQLSSSIHDYTQSVIQAFAGQGTPVAQVAVGNEITQGFEWNFTTLDVGSSTVTPAGTTTIDVNDAGGMQPGDTLFIDSIPNGNSIAGVADPSTDIVRIASIGTPGPSGTPITLQRPLAHSHTGPVTVQDVQDSGHLLFNAKTDTADWGPFTTLLKAAISGARAGNPSGNQLLVQLHIDRGADNATATDFVDHMIAAGVKFDVIGLSYYPWFHGPMSAMKANVDALINRFHKNVLIAEDQFPQHPQEGYGVFDAADANYPDTIPGYAVTPDGQASYQRDLLSLMASMPENRGAGVFYWNGDSTGFLGQFSFIDDSAQPIVFADQLTNQP